MTEFERFLLDSKVKFLKDFDLQYQTYFKTGGKADFFIMPTNKEEMATVIKRLNNINKKFKVIGATTNLFLFDGMSYPVIISTKLLTGVAQAGNAIDVECGYALESLVRVCLINGLEGNEGLEGVPGTIGGAIFMNAGAYGYSISDCLIHVDCIDGKGDLIRFNNDECTFSYRESIFKNNNDLVVVGAQFRFESGERKEIAKKIEIFHIARHIYQEWAYPNLGSMVSLNKDIYGEIFNEGRIKYTYYFLKLLLRNPLTKFFMRKRPNTQVFNWLLKRHIINNKKVLFMNKYRYSFSGKSANILINDGTYTANDYVDHLLDISGLCSGREMVENEFLYNEESLSKELKSKLKLLKKSQ